MFGYLTVMELNLTLSPLRVLSGLKLIKLLPTSGSPVLGVGRTGSDGQCEIMLISDQQKILFI